jgi:hypothetical protein
MSDVRRAVRTGVLLMVITVLGGCYGSGTATYVGVYGPSPWYGYPYPGRYPGGYYGGGGWIGVTVCCEEQQEEEQQQQGHLPSAPGRDDLPADTGVVSSRAQ